MDLNNKQVHQLNMMNEAARRSDLGDIIKTLIDGGGGGGISENGLPTGGTEGQILKKTGNENYISDWSDPDIVEGTLPVGGSDGQILAKSGNQDYSASWVEPPTVEGTLPSGGSDGQILVKLGGDDYESSWKDIPTPTIPNISEVVRAGNDLQGTPIKSTYINGSRTQNMQLDGTQLMLGSAISATRAQKSNITITPTSISVQNDVDEPNVYGKTDTLDLGGVGGNVLRYTNSEYRFSPERIVETSVTLGVQGFRKYSNNQSSSGSIRDSISLTSSSLSLIETTPTFSFTFKVDPNDGITFSNGITNPAAFSINATNGLTGSQQMYQNMSSAMGVLQQLRGVSTTLSGGIYTSLLPTGTTIIPDISGLVNGYTSVVTFSSANDGAAQLCFSVTTGGSTSDELPIKKRDLSDIQAGEIVANMTYTLYLYKPNSDNLTDAAWIIQL